MTGRMRKDSIAAPLREIVVTCVMLVGAATQLHAQPMETVEYYAVDSIGSVRVVFDATGNILGRMDYAPFGGELTSGAALPSLRFAGLTRDGEAGLDYAQARMYQCRTGRFTVSDPVYGGVFDPQQWNRYSYASNSPLNFVDPTGEQVFRTRNNPACETHPGNCAAAGPVATTGGPSEVAIAATSSGDRPRVLPTHDREARGASGRYPVGGFAESVGDLGQAPRSVAPPVPPNAPALGNHDQIREFGKGVKDTVAALNPFDGQRSCLTVFAVQTLSNLMPFPPSLATPAESIAVTTAMLEYNRALRYASSRTNYLGGRGLMFAFKSRPFSQMVGRSQSVVRAAAPLALGLAMVQALHSEQEAWKAGTCR